MIPITIVELPVAKDSLNCGTQMCAVPRVGDVLWSGSIRANMETPPFVVTRIGWVTQTTGSWCFVFVERRPVNA